MDRVVKTSAMPMCQMPESAAIISAIATYTHRAAATGKVVAKTLVQKTPALGLVKLVQRPVRKACPGADARGASSRDRVPFFAARRNSPIPNHTRYAAPATLSASDSQLK